jgi:hypothetical protein
MLSLMLILFVAVVARSRQSGAELTLDKKIARFAPTTITADVSKLSAGDKKALAKLIEAAKLLDEIYLRQVWDGNVALRARLEKDTSPEGKRRLKYFNIHMTPWPKIDNERTYIPGVPDHKPSGAAYYPDDLGRDEWAQWLITQSDEEQKKAIGFFHVVRRGAGGKLVIKPYSQEYKEFLVPASKLLKEAAALTTNKSLKKYLTLRAKAFLTDDYYASDVAWMDLDSPIDVTIGPYEVYLDELFNYKAAFEAYVTLRDDKETKKLKQFSSYLQDIEDHLPIDPKYRSPKLGAMSPIRVVDEVFIGGEARSGVQTAAFNLPNDERITKEKGSKRVMLKNVQEAKFNTILKPIVEKAIDPSQRSLVAFDPFFTHILMHELLHGLGPNVITVKGKETTVREQMQALSSAMEEAKADIAGLWALQYLIDKGVLPKETEKQYYVTYLAGIFRSVRFGVGESHGRGMALQFNYLYERGAFQFDSASATFRVNFDKIKEMTEALAGEIMTIQAEGDYEMAKNMFSRYANMGRDMQRAIDKMGDIPVDIEPIFPLAAPVSKPVP